MSSRLGSYKPKEVIRKLQKAGFYIDHQTGSHVILLNEREHRRVVVPYHVRDLKRGLLTMLIKQAGISIENFRNL